jgi:hypothetical protein
LAERDDYLRQLALALGERNLDRLNAGGRLESA